MTYNATGNLRASQTKIEDTVRHLGVDIDALLLVERTEI